ncbi:hypothetical protein ACLB2K_070195 [Fragaria x ananassa]
MASNMDSNRLELGGGNETDKLALLVIKAQIHQDPNRPVMSSWNESTHFCMWYGVTCSKSHLLRVTKLDLVNNHSSPRKSLRQTSGKVSDGLRPTSGNVSGRIPMRLSKTTTTDYKNYYHQQEATTASNKSYYHRLEKLLPPTTKPTTTDYKSYYRQQ